MKERDDLTILPGDFQPLLLRACISLLNGKMAEGFDTPEMEEDFHKAVLPLYISLTAFLRFKAPGAHPHWVAGSSISPAPPPLLSWTATKAEAVELMYELTHVGVFNNGNANTREVISWFEQTFHIRLGNTSKIFQEIRNRKKEITSLAGRMDKALLRYIDRLDQEEFDRLQVRRRA